MRILGNWSVRIGLVLLLGAGGFWLFTKLQKPPPPPPPTTVSVVVAKVDLYRRMVLTKDMVEIKEIAIKDAPETALKNIEDAVGFIVGSADTAVQVVPAGTVLESAHLLGRLKDLGLPYLVPPFMRAMIIEPKLVPNFHDVIRPGNRVDVVATFENEYSRIVLENIEVLAIDSEVNEIKLDIRGQNTEAAQRQREQAAEKGETVQAPPPPPPSFALALTPDDAERLALALASGSLDFILRPMPEEGLPPSLDGSLLTSAVEDGSQPATPAQGREGMTLADIAPPIAKKREEKTTGGGRPAPPQWTPSRPALPPAPRNIPVFPPAQLQLPTVPAAVQPMAQPAPPTLEIEIITGDQRRTVQVPKPEI